MIDALRERVTALPEGATIPTPALPGTAEAALAWALATAFDRPVVWIGDGRGSLDTMHRDLLALRPHAADRVVFFPPWDTLPGPGESPDVELAGQRLAVLTHLAGGLAAGPWILTTCVQAVMQRTPAPGATAAATLHLAAGDEGHDPAALAHRLTGLGYTVEPRVDRRGHCALRGGLLDVWPLDGAWPLRLEFLGDTLDSLRTFDPATQRSVERLSHAAIGPAVVADPAGSLFDYLPPAPVVIESNPDEMAHHARLFMESAREAGAAATVLDDDALHTRLAACAWALRVRTADIAAPPATCFLADIRPLPDLGGRRPEALRPDVLAAARQRLLEHLAARARAGFAVRIVLDTAGAAEHLRGLLGAARDTTPEARGIEIAVGALSHGFMSDTMRVALATQPDLYGRHKREARRYDPAARTRRPAAGPRVADITDIEPGDLVVHAEHGIGRYEGLTRITFNGTLQEVLTLEYADSARLYVPVSQAHLLTRYVGSDGGQAPLHRLGGKRWTRDKEAAREAIADLAASLLEIQAHRSLQDGYAYGPDVPWQHEFEAAFPYRETRDQHEVIATVKADMMSARPMDRLICGDAGYGKTEVAMRAAFKAVMEQKQVAVLVPTTVLAQQHVDTFATRMADYPVRIEVLSRFRSAAHRRATLRGMAEGTVDIVIGTHALLQPAVAFKDLGLVIIDEEQRFGVRHKEAFKQLRRMVDVLTLTATPIPRTLYLSMTGARDLSLLQTPPLERVPIETHVTRKSEAVVRQAILREINREGQVFYLHNRVMTIAAVTRQLQDLVPEARVAYAHGQMAAAELAEVMHRFVQGEFDVLVCTTIIESGMDIPRANTILVDRADRFGMADLYQLRGRVGRSSRKAYAYLLLPPHGRIDHDARQRVGALRRHAGLSAGFNLALRDLEIRGAGNMLGAAQSGHIAAIGFGLYCQLLRRTVARLQGKPLPPIVDVETALDFLDLAPGAAAPGRAAAGLPENYVDDDSLRVEIYRNLASAARAEDLAAVADEVRDRYGPLPPETRRLLEIARLRILAAEAGITRIETRRGKLILSRGADLLMRGTRFPRLTAGTPDAQLAEIATFIETWHTWSR